MLMDKVPALRAADLVLASGSPRRREILNDILGLRVRVVASTFAEDLDKALYTPQTYVQENARIKAREVWDQLVAGGDVPHLVIGGDTVVAHDGAILEKPKDRQHAVDMLNSLSGKSHTVFSGVALIFCRPGSGEVVEETFCEETGVTFAPLSAPLIEAYVDSGEPMDKAGAYGIQSAGGQFVSGITGCFYNVMGFPMHAFCVRLSAAIEQGRLALPQVPAP
jgi:septum formation protein